MTHGCRCEDPVIALVCAPSNLQSDDACKYWDDEHHERCDPYISSMVDIRDPGEIPDTWWVACQRLLDSQVRVRHGHDLSRMIECDEIDPNQHLMITVLGPRTQEAIYVCSHVFKALS